MTVLALQQAAYSNGVARLHGADSRRMWKQLWPELPESEVPIGSITNGIHTRSWISHDMAELFTRYLGPRFLEEPMDQSVWKRVEAIPAAELWRIHERRRERLVFFARKRLRQQLQRQGAGPGVPVGGGGGARPGNADHRLRPPVRRPTSAPTCCSCSPSA